jgi:hypothetical protein
MAGNKGVEMNDQQPEAAHAASEIEDSNPYGDDSIVLKFLIVLIALISLLAAWASLE